MSGDSVKEKGGLTDRLGLCKNLLSRKVTDADIARRKTVNRRKAYLGLHDLKGFIMKNPKAGRKGKATVM